jgi:hypothetical protein
MMPDLGAKLGQAGAEVNHKIIQKSTKETMQKPT